MFSGSNKRQKIGICCFSAKNAALRRKSKKWLAQNQDNVSGWGNKSTRRLLLAHLAKGHLSVFHHLVSVVLSFHIWIFSSTTTWSNESKLGRKHPRKVLYVDCSCLWKFTNMATIGNSRFRLGQFLKILLLWNRLVKWTEHGRKHLWKVLYIDCSFHPDPFTNMTVIGNSCFWLVNF
jgi:hypothetical protein